MFGEPYQRHDVVVYFTLEGGRGRETERTQMRLVVRANEPLETEVLTQDRRGDASWRPAKGFGGNGLVERILVNALLKSQMTPLQRIQNPQMLHPDGVVWMERECQIQLGTVKL